MNREIFAKVVIVFAFFCSVFTVPHCAISGSGNENNSLSIEVGQQVHLMYYIQSTRKKINQLIKEKKYRELKILMKDAADNYNECNSSILLAGTYLSGMFGGTQDCNKALYYMKKASDAGHPRATQYLGEMYMKGKCTYKNQSKGEELLEKAITMNNLCIATHPDNQKVKFPYYVRTK